MFDFSLLTAGNSCFVKFHEEEGDTRINRTVALDDFINLLTKIANPGASSDSKVLEDTGFIPNTLIKRTKYTHKTVLTFYYQSILSKFKIVIPESSFGPFIKTLIEEKFSKHLEFKQYNREEYVLEFKKHMKVPEVLYCATVFSGGNYRENILFPLPKTSGMFKEDLTGNSTVAYSFLPNHFADKVCWGRTETDYTTHFREAYQGDLKAINSHAYLYLNSVFNTDLMTSPSKRSLNNSELTKIKDFYTNLFEADIEDINKLFLSREDWVSILIQIALACDITLREEFSHHFRTASLNQFCN